MTTPAENDEKMQGLYREKSALYEQLLGMATGAADVDKAAMREALDKLQAADNELNLLTEEMFYTVLTDLRR